MAYATACLKQFGAFIAETDGNARVIRGTPLFNHIGEVMDVYHGFGTSVACELFKKYLQQRPAAHGDKRLGHSVCHWLQPGAQSGSKYHRFHLRDLRVEFG